MRDFSCPRCGQRLAFENSRCLSCQTEVRLDLPGREFVALDPDGTGTVRDETWTSCANLYLARCNWLTSPDRPLCRSCSLTRTRPHDGDIEGLAAFAAAEAAKRRMVLELFELGLPVISREEDPDFGLCFDLLSSAHEKIFTGHADGVVTLDLDERDDVHRTQLRVSMDEPYRTVLGHFRHETGHAYWWRLAGSGEARADFEKLFGDPDLDYQQALDRHYAEGAPPGWEGTFVSSYATMHPAEDWAETFAHYLHIRGTLDTAAAFGMAPAGATMSEVLAGDPGFDKLIALWLPLSWSLNMVNRSMGRDDLYPFVLADAVLEKMRLVHHLVVDART